MSYGLCLGVALMLVALSSGATYNANMTGQLEGVWTYADSDQIYFRLLNQPASHPGCSPIYFVIPASVPLDRRKMLYARLMVAYATKETVNIGYDNQGDCADGYIHVHRVG